MKIRTMSAGWASMIWTSVLRQGALVTNNICLQMMMNNVIVSPIQTGPCPNHKDKCKSVPRQAIAIRCGKSSHGLSHTLQSKKSSQLDFLERHLIGQVCCITSY